LDKPYGINALLKWTDGGLIYIGQTSIKNKTGKLTERVFDTFDYYYDSGRLSGKNFFWKLRSNNW